MTKRSITPVSLLLLAGLVTLPGCADQPPPTGPDAPGLAADVTPEGLILTVTSLDDAGAGTLRQALDLAPDASIIRFAPGLAGQTIALEGSLEVAGKSIEIEGPAPKGITIDAGGSSRVIKVAFDAGLVIRNLTLTGGNATSGAGIQNLGTLTIFNSTISGNRAAAGGAGVDNIGVLSIVSSTISGNEAMTDGGGVFNSTIGILIVRNSTISGNVAGIDGGGIANFGTLLVEFSTIASNSAANRGGVEGIFTTRSTILAGNTNGDCDAVIDGGFNLDSDGSCGFTAASSLSNTDPMLGPLADNGGPTRTHALLEGSPAIGAGPTDCSIVDGTLEDDQRGIVRPQGTGCDMGAYEFTSATIGIGDGTVDRSTGAATIAGTIECSGPHVVELQVALSQQQKVRGVDTTVNASDRLAVACDVGTSNWSLTLTPASGAFVNSSATVAVAALNTSTTSDAESDVRLSWARRR